MSYVYAALLFGALGGLYALLYYLNHKTPVPEGCENLKEQCHGCHDTACANNPIHDGGKEDNI